MPEYIIGGIKVSFPYEPYDLQKNYMAKVIECLENEKNGILESPTGTGKTLCLLCGTLAWIHLQKLKVHEQKEARVAQLEKQNALNGIKTEQLPMLRGMADAFEDPETRTGGWGVPKVIYASRTHSQLSQAMQELKRTEYRHLKAAVIGSRDQLCIHPDVIKETTNANKIHMCKLKIATKTCSYHFKLEQQKDNPIFRNTPILDIEDLVKAGKKVKCCPFFVSRELISDADIVFMPYNYLIDPKVRKAHKVELNNTIIIFDEAHNVERLCEQSVSVQITSTEIAVCIADVTQIMKDIKENRDMGETSTEFTEEDLVLLKEILLNLEKVVDEIEVPNKDTGKTFAGSYMFDLLEKANITCHNFASISLLLENLIQFLTTVRESNSVFRRGGGLEKLLDLLTIVFANSGVGYRDKVIKCFKVHVEIELTKQKGQTSKDGWIQPKASSLMKNTAKLVSYWCFSPGFGMQQLLEKNARSIILTSGTLAPLKPLISELGIPIDVRLENPHIVTTSQVCVKIISQGPDKEPLISNFDNRNNPKYINSLGRTILSFCPVIPHGILIFFPSYSVLNKCKDSWQASGIWSQIQRHKPIFIEPQTKEAFLDTMSEYYVKVNDPITKGAIFLAVCRGKVSEGLDFADINGRAVIITGLPFPPLTDARIILKKKYLQENRTKDNEMLSGDDWYFLEASRAVNQAIGRVIRHRYDYGAILLCDFRFNQPRQKNQLSSWIQTHLNTAQHSTFGPIIGDVSRFFRNAERTLPQPGLKPRLPEIDLDFSDMSERKAYDKDISSNTISYDFSKNILKKENIKSEPVLLKKANSVFGWDMAMYEKPSHTQASGGSGSGSADFLSRLNNHVTTINFNESTDESSLVKIHKRVNTSPLFSTNSSSISESQSALKKRRFKIVPNETVTSSIDSVANIRTTTDSSKTLPQDRKELLQLLKSSLSPPHYALFIKALTNYQQECSLDNLITAFVEIFGQPCFHYLFKGMRRFVKDHHKQKFDEATENLL